MKKGSVNLLGCLLLWFQSATWAASYLNPLHSFQLDYDENSWEVVPERTEKAPAPEVDKKMAEQILVTLQRKQPDEKYHARFHVVTDSLEKFKQKSNDKKLPPILQYQKYTVDFLKSQRFQILSVQPTQLPHIKDTTVEIVANQRDFGLKFRQVLFIHEDKIYILTGTTRTEKFEEYQKELSRMYASFQFLPKVK